MQTRRGLFGRALGVLAAMGAAAVASPAAAAAVAVPGRLVSVEWFTYETANVAARHGWREIERDVRSQRMLMQFDGPMTTGPLEVTMRCEDVASARLADMNRLVNEIGGDLRSTYATLHPDTEFVALAPSSSTIWGIPIVEDPDEHVGVIRVRKYEQPGKTEFPDRCGYYDWRLRLP
jgi:hypothetical protein